MTEFESPSQLTLYISFQVIYKDYPCELDQAYGVWPGIPPERLQYDCNALTHYVILPKQ